MAVNLKDGFIAKKNPLEVERITKSYKKTELCYIGYIIPFKTVNCKHLGEKDSLSDFRFTIFPYFVYGWHSFNVTTFFIKIYLLHNHQTYSLSTIHCSLQFDNQSHLQMKF